ncbi:MAG TPA: hypothetical protein PK687_06380 [Candidatus Avimonas sp.]|jgi:hypothetical protein|nr:hypothetical protein [Candidatus Avimonas sp.]
MPKNSYFIIDNMPKESIIYLAKGNDVFGVGIIAFFIQKGVERLEN